MKYKKMYFKLLTHDNCQYIDPEDCLSPEGTKIIKIIKNTGDYTIARINYKGKNKNGQLAMRWNLTKTFKENAIEGDYCVGLPSLGRTPLWFLLPEDVFNEDMIK